MLCQLQPCVLEPATPCVIEPALRLQPYVSVRQVLLTPHIGWQRLETRQRVLEMVAANIAAFARDEPTHVVS